MIIRECVLEQGEENQSGAQDEGTTNHRQSQAHVLTTPVPPERTFCQKFCCQIR